MKNHVVCLYEKSGLSARPWAKHGLTVFCYDLQHKEITSEKHGGGKIVFMPWDAKCIEQNKSIIAKHRFYARMVLAFPPCTDLAVSGAAHFAAKSAKNPLYRAQAMQLVYTAKDIAEALGAPYAIENPVSVISTEWRKPDYTFHPYEYGGYLPENDVHPLYPEFIAPRDAYPKKTCYWTGNGFVMPPKKPIEPEPGYSRQHKLLGGKSAKTKNIRSCSPRGIAQAIYEHNK